MQVDNMHARLYKDMIISSDQRQQMAAYWLQWKRRRRHLDTLVDTACDHLKCLPVHLDLPPTFFSHLSSLCQPPHTPHPSSDCSMHDVHAHGNSAGGRDGGGGEPPVYLGKAVDFSGFEPRFLGQDGEQMEHGNGAVQVLRNMSMLDRDMYADNLAAQMPGVFVNSVQVQLLFRPATHSACDSDNLNAKLFEFKHNCCCAVLSVHSIHYSSLVEQKHVPL